MSKPFIKFNTGLWRCFPSKIAFLNHRIGNVIWFTARETPSKALKNWVDGFANG